MQPPTDRVRAGRVLGGWVGGYVWMQNGNMIRLQATVEMLAQGGQPLYSDRRAPTP